MVSGDGSSDTYYVAMIRLEAVRWPEENHAPGCEARQCVHCRGLQVTGRTALIRDPDPPLRRCERSFRPPPCWVGLDCVLLQRFLIRKFGEGN